MILAANDLSLIVQENHIEDAIDLCIKLLPNYNSFTFSSGKSDIAQAGAILIADLKDAKDHTLSRKEIIRKNWMNFDAELLDKLIVNLEGAEFVTQTMNEKREVSYKLTAKMLKVLEGG